MVRVNNFVSITPLLISVQFICGIVAILKVVSQAEVVNLSRNSGTSYSFAAEMINLKQRK